MLDAYGRLSASRSAGPSSWPTSLACGGSRPRQKSATARRSRPNPGARNSIAAIKYRVYRFHDVKTKVGVEGQDDVRRLRWFRRILGPWVDLRLDANEAWPAAELLERVEPLRRFSLSVLEQPVPHAEVMALADLRAGNWACR